MGKGRSVGMHTLAATRMRMRCLPPPPPKKRIPCGQQPVAPARPRSRVGTAYQRRLLTTARPPPHAHHRTHSVPATRQCCGAGRLQSSLRRAVAAKAASGYPPVAAIIHQFMHMASPTFPCNAKPANTRAHAHAHPRTNERRTGWHRRRARVSQRCGPPYTSAMIAGMLSSCTIISSCSSCCRWWLWCSWWSRRALSGSAMLGSVVIVLQAGGRSSSRDA